MPGYFRKIAAIVPLFLSVVPAFCADPKQIPCSGKFEPFLAGTNDGVYIVPTTLLPCSDALPGKALVLPKTGSDSPELNGFAGGVVLPLADGLTLTAEGKAAFGGADSYGGFGGHAIISQDDKTSLGFFGTWAGDGSDAVYSAGQESKFSSGPFSFSSVAGWQSKGKRKIFGEVRAEYNLTDATNLHVGMGYRNGGVAAFGFDHNIELMTGNTVTLFADASVYNKGNDYAAEVGVRMPLDNKSYCTLFCAFLEPTSP